MGIPVPSRWYEAETTPTQMSWLQNSQLSIGCGPFPVTVANTGLGLDSLLKRVHVILVVTGILGRGHTQVMNSKKGQRIFFFDGTIYFSNFFPRPMLRCWKKEWVGFHPPKNSKRIRVNCLLLKLRFSRGHDSWKN